MINEWLNELGNLITSNLLFGILLAFIGGLLTSFTPCALTNIPLVISYTSEATNNKRKAFYYSLIFCIGMVITYTSLGVISVLIGNVFVGAISYYYIFLGILMLIMALIQIGIIPNIIDKIGFSFFKSKGIFGALIFGMIGAIFSTPCSTPVLVAILSVVSTKHSIVLGILMLLTYSIGHSILILIVGTFWGILKVISNSNKYQLASKIIKIVLFILLLIIAGLFIYQGIVSIN